MEKNSSATSSQVALALLVVYLVWGSTYLAIRIAVESIPPFFMAGIRFITSGLVLYAFERGRGQPRPRWIEWRTAAIVGGFLLLGGNGAVVWAEQRVPSGLASLLVSMVPVWMVVFEWMWSGGIKPNGWTIFGLACGFLGLVILSNVGGLKSDQIPRSGLAVLVFAAISWAFGSIYSRRAPLPTSAFLATSMEMMAGGLLLLVASVIAKEPAHLNWATMSSRSIYALVYLTLVGSLLGFTAYIWLLHNTRVAVASTYAYVNPVVALFLGWWLMAEPFTGRMFVGSLLILFAVAIMTVQRSSASVKAEIPSR